MDVLEHTIFAISKSKNDFVIRLVLLLHDIGKPFSYQDDNDGIRHFHDHPKVSQDMSEKILTRLEVDQKLKETICYLIRLHDEPITLDEIKNDPELQSMRLEVQRCDALAHNPIYNKKRLKYLENMYSTIAPFLNKKA